MDSDLSVKTKISENSYECAFLVYEEGILIRLSAVMRGVHLTHINTQTCTMKHLHKKKKTLVATWCVLHRDVKYHLY